MTPLDKSVVIERHYVPDREAMLAALRVMLGLRRPLPTMASERTADSHEHLARSRLP